mmetsp:Transcript_10451/g.19071  ORF Transcript_10451/g.19071 Transcript_10451/m.19071 type:complete len:207 (+) Transcript_10451:1801-2421(+)
MYLRVVSDEAYHGPLAARQVVQRVGDRLARPREHPGLGRRLRDVQHEEEHAGHRRADHVVRRGDDFDGRVDELRPLGDVRAHAVGVDRREVARGALVVVPAQVALPVRAAVRPDHVRVDVGPAVLAAHDAYAAEVDERTLYLRLGERLQHDAQRHLAALGGGRGRREDVGREAQLLGVAGVHVIGHYLLELWLLLHHRRLLLRMLV